MFFKNFKKWWLFNMANPVISKGEKGGFRYCFRRYWLDVSTVSGNFKMRTLAGEHPYAYLLESVMQDNEENVYGLAQFIYVLQSTLTRDQDLVDDVKNALAKFERKTVENAEPESEDSEIAALEAEKKVQEYVDAPKKVRRQMERDANGRFRKAVKEAEKHEGAV